jgi:hypothetical protein
MGNGSSTRREREAIQGPIFRNYLRTVENFHGWDDGDGFVTSYIAHPKEGAMAGFLERQNDPKFRDAIAFSSGSCGRRRHTDLGAGLDGGRRRR